LEHISTETLIIILVVLIICSGFFSGSETGMMSLNRYRLKHHVKNKKRGAILTQGLLSRPDRLIGLILIGNNFVNIMAAAIATIICERIWGAGPASVLIATIGLTFIVLVFAEVTPKTLAALHPEKVAFPASYILTPLYKLLIPAVVGLNFITNGLLKLIRVDVHAAAKDTLDSDELKIIVNEAGALIPKRHQSMLLSILDLEKVTVEDIMIPRSEITGIDIEQPIEIILSQLKNSVHSRLPVYRTEIDHVVGFLHARQMVKLLTADDDYLSKEAILDAINPVYFIPEGTPLNTQLLNFQRKKLRIGLVVDEYGDILGLATIEDILEEIVGEFTTDFADTSKDIQKSDDGSIIIDGSTTVRDINRNLSWKLPTDGPKTLNGLIIEYIESIPQAGTGMRLYGYPMEILQVKANMVKSVKVWPALFKKPIPKPAE
jgi:Mg2+/Co2+ transporter CorB